MGIYIVNDMTDEIKALVTELFPDITNPGVEVLFGSSCITWVISGNFNQIACFTLSSFDNNSHVIISSSAYVESKYRGVGLGQRLHDLRIKIARASHYSTILCTVNPANAIQIHILEKNGWKFLLNAGGGSLLYGLTL